MTARPPAPLPATRSRPGGPDDRRVPAPRPAGRGGAPGPPAQGTGRGGAGRRSGRPTARWRNRPSARARVHLDHQRRVTDLEAVTDTQDYLRDWFAVDPRPV